MQPPGSAKQTGADFAPLEETPPRKTLDTCEGSPWLWSLKFVGISGTLAKNKPRFRPGGCC